MRDDFCALILTHGRPDRVDTLRALERCGYTGKVYLVVDDEDKTRVQYLERYGDRVLTFSKVDIAARFDECDNFGDRRSIFYARNASFELAEQVGCRYFIQLDDDYTGFYSRFNGEAQYGGWAVKSLDEMLLELLAYFEAIPAASICVSQGGDHMGGGHGLFRDEIYPLRKAMNTFICDTQRPFRFSGRINEDVNTYTAGGRRGELFLTIPSVQVNQRQTQANSGGMTELYRDNGTYVKSFYSVINAPSCVKISEFGSAHRRIHHRINWETTSAKIVHERHRKAA